MLSNGKKECKITVRILNGEGKELSKRSFKIKGYMRFQLLASAKCLNYITGTLYDLNGHGKEVVIELENIDPKSSDLFRGLIKRHSPIPVRFLYVSKTVEEVE
jgi:hypothetical protein